MQAGEVGGVGGGSCGGEDRSVERGCQGYTQLRQDK